MHFARGYYGDSVLLYVFVEMKSNNNKSANDSLLNSCED